MPHLLAVLKPPSAAWLETLRDQWGELVGPGIAANTTPEMIEGTTLVVRVTSHVWLMELRAGLGKMVQDKVNTAIQGKITKINWTA